MELKLTIELLHGDRAESQVFRVSNPAEPGNDEAAVKLVEALTRLVDFEEVMVALHREMAWKYEGRAVSSPPPEPDEEPAAIGEGQRAPDEADDAGSRWDENGGQQ